MQATGSLVKSSAARFYCAESVPDGISNALHGSKIQWRGISFAASVPSDSSKFQRAKKRLTRDERYSLIKSFVERYRDMNAGKFPTVTIIRKQVGGSHYTVRDIFQRIVHEQRRQSVDKKIEGVTEKTGKQILSQIDAEKESFVSANFENINSDSLTEAGKSDRPLETGTMGNVRNHKILDETSEHIGVDSTEVSAYVQIDGTEKQAATNSKASSRRDPSAHGSGGRSGIEVAQPFDVQSSKRGENVSKDHDYRSESQRETSKSMASKEESPSEKSTVWGRVKSLAEGFLNFWK